MLGLVVGSSIMTASGMLLNIFYILFFASSASICLMKDKAKIDYTIAASSAP
jgi:hypothetical protein